MKKLLFTILAVILTVSVLAQTPQKMSYQAVIRNSASELVKNHSVGMKVSILQGSETGSVVYTETLTPSTNANGLVSVEIGGGAGFDNINWSTSIYYIKTETDPTGGTNYDIVGTSRLLSVPYSLHSKTAEIALSGDYNNLINKPILFNGNYNSLTNLPTLFDGDYNQLRNKPTLFDGKYTSLTDKPTLFDGKFTSLTDKPTTALGYGLTDVMTTSHLAYGIVEENINNWNTAYTWSEQAYTWSEQLIGWGNHSDAGYLKSTTTGINPNFMKVNLINTVNDGLLVFSTPNQQWEVKPITDFASVFSLSGHTHTELDPYFSTWFELTGQDDARPYDYMGWNGTKWVRTRNTFAELNHNHPVVDVMLGAAGFMSTMDKSKLDVFPLPATNGTILVSAEGSWEPISMDYFATSDHGHTVATPVSSGFMSNLDKTKLDGLTAADGSETIITGNPGITIKGNGTTTTPYTVTITQHTVGETYGGGIVFYVYDNGQHGLIAATADATINGNPNLSLLYNGPIRVAGAFGNGVGAGKANTSAIVAMQASLTPSLPWNAVPNAAYACIYVTSTDANNVRNADWYLPSYYEMILMSNSTAAIPGFVKTNPYWSSTEDASNINNAFMVVNGAMNMQDKRNGFRVRPIRSF